MEIKDTEMVLVRPFMGSGMKVLHAEDTQNLRESFELTGTLALLEMIYLAPATASGEPGSQQKSETYLMEPADVGALIGMLDEIRETYSDEDHRAAKDGYQRSRRPEAARTAQERADHAYEHARFHADMLKTQHPEIAGLVDAMFVHADELKAKLAALHEDGPTEQAFPDLGVIPIDKMPGEAARLIREPAPDVESMTPEEYIGRIKAALREDEGQEPRPVDDPDGEGASTAAENADAAAAGWGDVSLIQVAQAGRRQHAAHMAELAEQQRVERAADDAAGFVEQGQ